MKYPIKTQEEFEALMEEVDSILQAKGVPIHARQIQAVGEVSKKFNIDLLIGPLRKGATPHLYEGESLSAHILDWFDQRYGERLKVDFSIGYSVVILKGDAWLLKCPLMYGTVTVVCDRDLKKEYKNFVVNQAGKPQEKAMMNLLRLIEKFPQGLANRLLDEELRFLLSDYISANKVFSTVHDSCAGNELASGAVTDFETSARFAVGNAHGYGQSLWASLQAAEKILKFFIASKGDHFPQTHDLTKLANQAYTLGLPIIDEDLLKEVQCKAGVRYEQSKYTTQKVVSAHQGAIKIALIVVESLFPTVVSKSATKDERNPSDTILIPGRFYISPSLGFSYYCKDITDGLATLIMVESYQHGRLIQVVFTQKVEYQNYYLEITDEDEIKRLKQVGEKIFHDQGII